MAGAILLPSSCLKHGSWSCGSCLLPQDTKHGDENYKQWDREILSGSQTTLPRADPRLGNHLPVNLLKKKALAHYFKSLLVECHVTCS